jgi:hypothetical protein
VKRVGALELGFDRSGGHWANRLSSAPQRLAAGEEVRFALDSLLEGDGFEPSVPRAMDGILSSLAMRVLQAGR